MTLTSESSTRVNAPEGTYPVLCVDFVEQGMKQTAFGDKEKVQFVFETPHRHPEYARPLTVASSANVSFNEKATLRKFMESWRGKKYTEAEVKAGVDPEQGIGRPALVTVEHVQSGENTYANITAIMPLPDGMTAPTPSGEYERVKDRDGGWDVRSPNSKAVTGLTVSTAADRAAAPSGGMQTRPVEQRVTTNSGEEFGADPNDPLPFKTRG